MTFEINKNSFLPEVSEDLEECTPVENSGRKEILDTSRAREEIKRQIEYDVMVQRCQPSQLDELVEIMLQIATPPGQQGRNSRSSKDIIPGQQKIVKKRNNLTSPAVFHRQERREIAGVSLW